jgi:hypothetical protein
MVASGSSACLGHRRVLVRQMAGPALRGSKAVPHKLAVVSNGSPPWNGPEDWSYSWDHMCTLDLAGSGLSDELGERWKPKIVITGLRPWEMRLHGKTKRAQSALGSASEANQPRELRVP